MTKNTISANKILALCPSHNSLHIPETTQSKKVENKTYKQYSRQSSLRHH